MSKTRRIAIKPLLTGYYRDTFCGIPVLRNVDNLINLSDIVNKAPKGTTNTAKRYSGWKRNKDSKKCIQRYTESYKEKGIIADKFMVKIVSGQMNLWGTYGVEELAFVVANWSCLKLDMETPEYKRLIGLLETEKEAISQKLTTVEETLVDTSQKLKEETKEKHKYKIALYRQREKVPYPKLSTEKCLYIWRNPKETEIVYKVGKATDINDRLNPYRTNTSLNELLFLVYITDTDTDREPEPETLEKRIKQRFKQNLVMLNHELYRDIELETLTTYITTYLQNEGIQHRIETDLVTYNTFVRDLADNSYDNVE